MGVEASEAAKSFQHTGHTWLLLQSGKVFELVTLPAATRNGPPLFHLRPFDILFSHYKNIVAGDWFSKSNVFDTSYNCKILSVRTIMLYLVNFSKSLILFPNWGCKYVV